MGRILAIDFGKKRVGLAVTDPFQIISTGLKTVENKNVIKFLKDYCEKEVVDTFIVGEPKKMDGTAFEIEKDIAQFIGRLKTLFPKIPVIREDERFTSKMASQTISQLGLKKKDRENKSLIDEISAIIILKSYLEKVQGL